MEIRALLAAAVPECVLVPSNKQHTDPGSLITNRVLAQEELRLKHRVDMELAENLVAPMGWIAAAR
jgi:hypothetical protein